MDDKTLVRWKGAGAVFAGLVTIIVMSAATDMILEATSVFPSVEDQRSNGFAEPWMLALTLAYRFVYTVIGGGLTARLAPGNPMGHAMVLAGVGTAIGGLASIAVASMGIFPLWYSIALVVIGFPAIWIGAKLVPSKADRPTMARADPL